MTARKPGVNDGKPPVNGSKPPLKNGKTTARRSAAGVTNLEDPVAETLVGLGWKVVDTATWNHLVKTQAEPGVTEFMQKAIVRQYTPRVVDLVTGRVRNFRLDFAHPLTMCALEVDGYRRDPASKKPGQGGGHVTWTGFHNDRARDRCLTIRGWRVLRCGPGDLRTPKARLTIVKQFTGLIRQLSATDQNDNPGSSN